MKQIMIPALAALVLSGCASDPDKARLSDLVRVDYRCEDGSSLTVTYYPNTTPDIVQVERDGETFVLQAERAASGALYSGSTMEWWNKGDQGNLTVNGVEIGECQEG